jgi:hypothetical protein
LQVSADWGNMAAARTGGRTARRRAGNNFSHRRGRTRPHGRVAASGSPLALLLVNRLHARSLSLPPARSVSPAHHFSLSFPRRFQSFSRVFPQPRTEASP